MTEHTMTVVPNDDEGTWDIYWVKEGESQVTRLCSLESESVAYMLAATPETAAERDRLRADKAELVRVLEEILNGCDDYRPGHVLADLNRTKREIAEIARAILAKVGRE